MCVCRCAHDCDPIQVIFRATLEQAQRRIPPAFGTLSEVEAGTLFETRQGDLAQVAHYLVGVALPFTVQAPDELKTQLATLADHLHQAAGLAP